ncbi:MAG: 3-isopropylmalate dehydratase large subunit [Desulfobacterales bacterium]|nr:3-isopropylmalate dehydratase large subunit [Desulfobacterales bacterium]
MGLTMAEKILARASGQDNVHPNNFVTAELDIVMGHDLSFWAAYLSMTDSGFKNVFHPDKIVVIIDHAVPATNYRVANLHKQIREWVNEQNIRHFYDCGVGICHQVLPEKGHALPGRLIVGGDSHTTTYGALGVASCGIGISDLAYAMAKGSQWFMVPETIRFELNGTLPKGVSSKDIILYIAGKYTAEVAQYKAVEFMGPAAGDLSIGDRMTISNMGVEIGAKFAFFETDAKTQAFLKNRTQSPVEHLSPDGDASYAAVYDMDVTDLEPQVACPHNVDNVKPISEIGDIPVDQAFLGSCTNARLEDLERAAAILKGKSVHPETRLIVIPASHEIYQKAMASGILQILLDAGAMLAPSGCGPCGGRHIGILAEGETAITTTNRNFKGRMGSPESFIYLGSPETIAASAIEGKIADPRKYL